MEIGRKWRFSCLLLGLLFLATTLQDVQGEVESEGPSESECRPYIEKALKELETADTEHADLRTPADGESHEDIPITDTTIDDSEHETSAGEDDTDVIEPSETEQDTEDSLEKTDEQTPETDEKASAEEPEQAQESLEETDAAASTEQADEPQAESQEDDTKSVEDEEQKSGEDAAASVEEEEPQADAPADTEEDTASVEDAQESIQQASVEVTEAEPQSAEEASVEVPAEEGSIETADDEASVEAAAEEASKEDAADEASKEDAADETSVETAAGEDASVEAAAEEGSLETAADDASAEAAPEEGSVEAPADEASVEDEAEKSAEQAEAEAETSTEAEAEGEQSTEAEAEGEKSTEAEAEGDKSTEAEADEEKSTEAEADGEKSTEAEDEKSAEAETSGEAESVEDGEKSVEEGDKSVEEAEKSVEDGEKSAEDGEKSLEDGEKSVEEGDKSVEEGEEGEKSAEEEAAKQSVEDVAEEPEQADQPEPEEKEESKESVPEEDLTLEEFEIPENLRPRDQVDQLLKLDDSDGENALNRMSAVTLRELKRLYEGAIKPLETLYKYRDLSNRHFGDSEIFSKPLVLFMGPWSGGKSSIINYLLDNEYNSTSLRTGAEPSPAYFNLLMYGDEPEVLDGTQLAADFTFAGLQKFGQGLEERLRGLKLPNKLLEKINIVEIPGILEVRKQVSRVFPFNDACQWFIDRADIIFLVYDPSKLDVGPETEAILDQLKGREHQTRIVLNKADQVKPEELMRVQSALIWNISPLMSSAQPPVMYTTSLWSRPYESWAPVRLLQAQERAFLRDLRSAVDKRIENKISSARRFAVRVRNHAKMVDCYLTTYYNHKSVFGNRKQVSDQIIEHPQDYHIYEGLSTLTNISRYDLPDPDVYKDFFRLNPLYDFQQLSATCTYFRGCPINRLDVAIAYDLPEMVGKHKKLVESALAELKTES